MLRESQRTQAEEEVSNLVFAVKKIGESEIKNGKSTRDEQSLRFLHIPLLLGNGKWLAKSIIDQPTSNSA